MMRTIIESPFAGNDQYTQEEHEEYLQRCIQDCFERGEACFASHQMYTEALDDSNPEERAQGIKAGFEWRQVANKTAVYTDYGLSSGMQAGITHAAGRVGHTIEFRSIGMNPAEEVEVTE
jgi:hypothetical protein